MDQLEKLLKNRGIRNILSTGYPLTDIGTHNTITPGVLNTVSPMLVVLPRHLNRWEYYKHVGYYIHHFFYRGFSFITDMRYSLFECPCFIVLASKLDGAIKLWHHLVKVFKSLLPFCHMLFRYLWFINTKPTRVDKTKQVSVCPPQSPKPKQLTQRWISYTTQ